MPTKALLIVNTAVHCFILRFILYSVQRFSGLSIASKKIQSVIICGFVDFGNELSKMTYLPTNFEMELTLLSEMSSPKSICVVIVNQYKGVYLYETKSTQRTRKIGSVI